MTELRKSANGKACTLRLGSCSGSDTVVLAHIGRISGMGMKCGDHFAVYACSSCHDIIDGRVKHFATKGELAIDKLRALEETQQIHLNEGRLIIA